MLKKTTQNILATNPRVTWLKPLRWISHGLWWLELDFTNRISVLLIAMCQFLVFVIYLALKKITLPCVRTGDEIEISMSLKERKVPTSEFAYTDL